MIDLFKKEILNKKILEDFTRHDDRFLLRFLRARKFNLENAVKMISNYFEWRIRENIDEVESFKFPELKEFKEMFQHGYHNTDKLGRPIYIECYGNINVDKIFALTTSDRWLRYYVREYERLVTMRFRACSKFYGKVVEQTFNITDLSGVSLSLLTRQIKATMQEASAIGQNYFPEILGKVYLVNAPTIFTIIWGLVKSFLDPKTVQKMSLLKTDFQEKLLEHVSAENLPKRFGGTCECPCGCFISDIGPWNPDGIPLIE